MQPLISVIIPCYNVSKYLDRCMDSLLKQTIGYNKLELIFINDASTDNTLDMLLGYEEKYPDTVLVINLEENKKQGFARNLALEYATGKYIGYVDSDDWIKPNMFERLYETIEKYNCDFVECEWSTVDSKGKTCGFGKVGTPGYLDLSIYDNKREFLLINIFMDAAWNKLFKRDFLVDNDIFFLEDSRYEDIFFSFLCFLYSKSYYRINESLYYYFCNEEGTVLRRKEMYQLDKMKVALDFFALCEERGLKKIYPNEVEWLFLEVYYVYMLREIFRFFPDLSYEYYISMKATVKELAPRYRDNPYFQGDNMELDRFMIKLLDYDLEKNQLESLRIQYLKNF